MHLLGAHMTPSRRLTAILSALLGTMLLLAAPATAMAAQQPTVQRQAVHTTTEAAAPYGSHVHKHTSSSHTVHRPTTKTVHKVSVSKEKPKKKRGFFKKLGIFLIVLVILFIVIVVLVIWLIVHFVRKAFRRRG